jgi:cell division protease FtsH
MACVVARKTEAPLFLVSASELIEIEDGVDELDALGNVRGGAATTCGQGKRWRPLHQLLAEMDRLSGTDWVVVLAATNRSDARDPALVRPGRIDRRTTVVPPDLDGRRWILHVYTRSVPIAEDVDLEELAAATPDMVATDLGGLVTEAALLATIRNHSRVTRSDFSDALEQLTLGTT